MHKRFDLHLHENSSTCWKMFRNAQQNWLIDSAHSSMRSAWEGSSYQQHLSTGICVEIWLKFSSTFIRMIKLWSQASSNGNSTVSGNGFQLVWRVQKDGLRGIQTNSIVGLITTFVRPNLEYAQAVWSPPSRKLINMLKNVQKRATKLVDGFGILEYEERLRRLELPTLVHRRALGDMIEVFKHFHLYDLTLIPGLFKRQQYSIRKNGCQLMWRVPKDGFREIQTNFHLRLWMCQESTRLKQFWRVMEEPANKIRPKPIRERVI